MNAIIRSCAALAVALCIVLPRPALAGGGCSVTPAAIFPVTMDGPRATIAVTVNGQATRLWFDSGAFFNVMPKAKAAELGLATSALQGNVVISGIGGSFTPEVAKIRDFGIGDIMYHNMEFAVGGGDAGNGFLGANFLGTHDTELDLAKGKFMLLRESGCSHANLAYWAGKDTPVGEARLLSPDYGNDHHIFVEVVINGHALRAILDTGAVDTLVSRGAATRAGIDLASPEVNASVQISGAGSRSRKSWIARTRTISIGGETIQNSPIRVVDDHDIGASDMLLGIDFLLSHHVLVSQDQHKMFLTYNGGPIFSSTTDHEIGHMETRAVDMGSAPASTEPVTADDFAGRASGRLTRDEIPGAIADYTAAIKLAPGRADLLAGRATAYMRSHRPLLALRDIDAALTVNPTDYRLLTRRAQIRIARKNLAGALADTDAAAAATPKGSLHMIEVVQLYNWLGKADRGPALLDPVLELHRDDSTYLQLLDARSWNRALANADLDRTLKDCDTALRKAGPNAPMLNTRSLVQLRRKAYAAAIADASAALALAPKDSLALYFRGLARIASGDKPGALSDFAAARAIAPIIDAEFAPYGLTAPQAPAAVTPAQPSRPGEDDESGQ